MPIFCLFSKVLILINEEVLFHKAEFKQFLDFLDRKLTASKQNGGADRI
jgi:hypothetical protein